MIDTLALLVSPGGESLLVSPVGVEFDYAPDAETGGGDWGMRRPAQRRRWVVRHGKRLIEYATAAEAILAAEALQEAELAQEQKAAVQKTAKKARAKPAKRTPEPSAEPPAPPVQVAYIDQVKELARQYDEMAAYRDAMQRQQYDAVLTLFERLQDEADVELLLSVA